MCCILFCKASEGLSRQPQCHQHLRAQVFPSGSMFLNTKEQCKEGFSARTCHNSCAAPEESTERISPCFPWAPTAPQQQHYLLPGPVQLCEVKGPHHCLRWYNGARSHAGSPERLFLIAHDSDRQSTGVYQNVCPMKPFPRYPNELLRHSLNGSDPHWGFAALTKAFAFN